MKVNKEKVFSDIYEVSKERLSLSLTEKELEFLDAIGGYAVGDGRIFVYVEKAALEHIAKDLSDDERRIAHELINKLPWKDGECDLQICI